jgi:hypothetical protein
MNALVESPMGHVHHYVSEDDSVDVWIVDLEDDPDGDHAIIAVIVQPSDGVAWMYPSAATATGIFPIGDLAHEAYAAWRTHIVGATLLAFVAPTRGTA